MTKNGKKFMIVVAIIVVLLIIGSVIFTVTIPKKRKGMVKSADEDKYVNVLSDGTKENTSEKLKEDKNFDGLDITEIKLIENNQLTKLTGIITNNTDKIKGDYTAKIIFVDSKNNELSEMGFYIKQLQPGESTVLNASTTFDYSNAYNIIFRK